MFENSLGPFRVGEYYIVYLFFTKYLFKVIFRKWGDLYLASLWQNTHLLERKPLICCCNHSVLIMITFITLEKKVKLLPNFQTNSDWEMQLIPILVPAKLTTVSEDFSFVSILSSCKILLLVCKTPFYTFPSVILNVTYRKFHKIGKTCRQ